MQIILDQQNMYGFMRKYEKICRQVIHRGHKVCNKYQGWPFSTDFRADI